MPAAGGVEAVDVLKQRSFHPASGLPSVAPDQLCFQGFEEGEEDQKTVWGTLFPTQDNGIVLAISFPRHRDLEAVLSQQLLVFMAAIWAPRIRPLFAGV